MSDEMIDYDRQFHVKLITMPWRGAARTAAEDAIGTLVVGVQINGEHMAPRKNGVGILSPVENVSLHIDAFLTITLRDLPDESFDALDVTRDDWLEGSDRSLVMLPVASLTIEEAPVPDHQSRDRGGDRGPANVGL